MLERLVAIATVILLTGVPALGGEPDAKEWRRIADTLEAEQSAASLSTAGLIHLKVLKDVSGSLALLDRAATFAPTDPAIAWLALNTCASIDDCDVGARAARLLDLDGGNAAAHYPALQRARQSRDPAAEGRALAAMADSGYFDVYWARSLVRAADTLATPRARKREPLRGIQWAANDATDWLATAAIPSFDALSNSCKGERSTRDDVNAWCRRLAGVMENGDTYIAQSTGRAIAARVFDPTDPQLVQVEERKRGDRYVRDMVAPHVNDSMRTPETAAAWLDRFRMHRRETDVYRAWLLDLGIPPDPPTDYVPKTVP